jgi:hypothetical protein
VKDAEVGADLLQDLGEHLAWDEFGKQFVIHRDHVAGSWYGLRFSDCDCLLIEVHLPPSH